MDDNFCLYKSFAAASTERKPKTLIDYAFYVAVVTLGGAVAVGAYMIYDTERALQKHSSAVPAIIEKNDAKKEATTNLDSIVEMVIETEAGKKEKKK